MKSLFLFIFILSFSGFVVSDNYKYEIKYIDMVLDHFTFANSTTFKLRYLVNDSFASELSDDKTITPIFFYTGNEGDIELFAQNTGFLWDSAKKNKASVVFCEHRFYGKSMPFGNDSYKSPQHLGYLTSEQALADFADLLQFLNPNRSRPVITFGGSYGGMLAAWMKSKYPHLVTGALASSAPVLQFPGVVPCDIFSTILSTVYQTALERSCADNIKKSWDILLDYTKSEPGIKFINDKFKFCKYMNTTDEMKQFFDFLEDVYGNLAMANYPYAANFLAPLPAYPVRQFCLPLVSTFKNNDDFVSGFHQALSVYTNFTQKTKCLDYSSAYDNRMGDDGWNFQACSEMVMPMCNKKESIFIAKDWDFKAYSDDCFKKYGVRPKENAAMTQYGELEYASNIIFSNGLLDPWAGGGMLRSDSRSIHIVIIPEGAHHIDLREANEDDPESVRIARDKYNSIFKEWIRKKIDNVKRYSNSF